MHVLDDVEVLAGYDLFWTFPFEEVLDADVLGRALAEVIEMGEWRRLGGRFRRNVRTSWHSVVSKTRVPNEHIGCWPYGLSHPDALYSQSAPGVLHQRAHRSGYEGSPDRLTIPGSW